MASPGISYILDDNERVVVSVLDVKRMGDGVYLTVKPVNEFPYTFKVDELELKFVCDQLLADAKFDEFGDFIGVNPYDEGYTAPLWILLYRTPTGDFDFEHVLNEDLVRRRGNKWSLDDARLPLGLTNGRNLYLADPSKCFILQN